MYKLIPFAGLLALGTTGCAPMTEDQIVAREYRQVEYRVRFLNYKRVCEAEGGKVVIRSHRRVRGDRVPRPGDRYHCEFH